MNGLATVAVCVLAMCGVVAWILWTVKKDIEELADMISNAIQYPNLCSSSICSELTTELKTEEEKSAREKLAES